MPGSDEAADTPARRKPARPTQGEREAEALRANLRRRKQQASLRNEARQDEVRAQTDRPDDETTGE